MEVSGSSCSVSPVACRAGIAAMALKVALRMGSHDCGLKIVAQGGAFTGAQILKRLALQFSFNAGQPLWPFGMTRPVGMFQAVGMGDI